MLSTQDLCDQEGLLVQFACRMQIIATGNQAVKPFFGADEILAKGRVGNSPNQATNREPGRLFQTLLIFRADDREIGQSPQTAALPRSKRILNPYS